MPHLPCRRACIASLAIVMTACAGTEAPPRSAFTRLDSAGIAIVDNVAPAEQLAMVLETDSTPMLRIGVADGAEALLFSEIRGLARLSDGRIAVANGTPPEIRIFADSGSFVARRGGRGRGPGEFSYLSGLIGGAGDTLLAVNNPQFQSMRFTADGGFIEARTVSRDSIAARVAPLRQTEGLREWFANGAYVIATRDSAEALASRRRPAGELYRPINVTVWISADQTRSRVIGGFGEIQQHFVDLGGGRRSSVVPPSARWRVSALGARGRRFCIAPNETPEVHCVDEDGEHMIVRWSQSDVPTSDAAIERWKTRQREFAARPRSFDSPADMERIIAAAIIPPTMPPVSRVLIDTEGGLLVVGPDIQRSDGGRVQARVFSPSGELLGIADLPSIVIHELGPDYLLGVSRNDDGVEFVEMYRVRRAVSSEP